MNLLARIGCALLLGVAAADLFGQAQREVQRAEQLRAEARQVSEQAAASELLAQAQGREDAAARLFARAHRDGRLDAGQLHAYGAFLLRHAPDLAADIYAEAVARDPSSAAAYLGRIKGFLAVYPYRRDELPAAFEGAAAATAGAPVAQAQVYAHWADFHWRNGMFDLAETDWAHALTIDENTRLARIGLAATAFLDGEVAMAAQRIRELGEMTQEEFTTAARYMGDAHAAFVDSGAMFADVPANHLAYAMLLVSAYPNAPHHALLPLERVVTQDPANHEAWNFMGSVRRQVGDAAGAREAYRRSLAANPEQPYTRRLVEELAESD